MRKKRSSPLDSSYNPCDICDNASSMCIGEGDIAICIKEYEGMNTLFEKGKSYKITSVGCDNTGQHDVHVEITNLSGYINNNWFVLKYNYQISGMGFRIPDTEPAFYEYFEIKRISRLKKLKKLCTIQ